MESVEERNVLITSSVVQSTLLTALITFTFLLSVQTFHFLDHFEQFAGITLVLSSVLASIAQLSSTVAQSKLRTAEAVFLFPLLTYIIAFVAIIAFKLPMHEAVLLAYATPATIGFIRLKQTNTLSRSHISFSILNQSKYYATNNIAALSYNWLINVYVAALLGPKEVFLFTLIARVAAILSLPASASTPLIQAGISENRTNGENRSLAKFSGLIVVATVALQVICILFISLLGLLTDYLTDLFQSGLLVAFLLYCTTHVFHVLAGPAGTILLMTGKAKQISRLTVVLGALSLAFGILLTSVYGLAGTLFVSGVVSVIQNSFYSIMLYRRDGYLPIQAAFSSLGRFYQAPVQTTPQTNRFYNITFV